MLELLYEQEDNFQELGLARLRKSYEQEVNDAFIKFLSIKANQTAGPVKNIAASECGRCSFCTRLKSGFSDESW